MSFQGSTWNPQPLCNPLLWKPQPVHAEYLEIQFHLGCRPEIGDIGIYCLPGTADGLSNFRRGQTGIVLKFSSRMIEEMGIWVAEQNWQILFAISLM